MYLLFWDFGNFFIFVRFFTFYCSFFVVGFLRTELRIFTFFENNVVIFVSVIVFKLMIL